MSNSDENGLKNLSFILDSHVVVEPLPKNGWMRPRMLHKWLLQLYITVPNILADKCCTCCWAVRPLTRKHCCGTWEWSEVHSPCNCIWGGMYIIFISFVSSLVNLRGCIMSCRMYHLSWEIYCPKKNPSSLFWYYALSSLTTTGCKTGKLATLVACLSASLSCHFEIHIALWRVIKSTGCR